MLRKAKRTLSLVLALIMICSTMGVMAFALDDDAIERRCPACGKITRLDYYCYENALERVIECPIHEGAHDAEEWHIGDHYKCRDCKAIVSFNKTITYVCLI